MSKMLTKKILFVTILCTSFSLSQSVTGVENAGEKDAVETLQKLSFNVSFAIESPNVETTPPNDKMSIEEYTHKICLEKLTVRDPGKVLFDILRNRERDFWTVDFARLTEAQKNQSRLIWLHLLCLSQFKMTKLPYNQVHQAFSTFLHTLIPHELTFVPTIDGNTPFHSLFQQIRNVQDWARIYPLCALLLAKFPQASLGVTNEQGETPFTTFLSTYRYRFLPDSRANLKTMCPTHNESVLLPLEVFQFFNVNNVVITVDHILRLKEIVPPFLWSRIHNLCLEKALKRQTIVVFPPA